MKTSEESQVDSDRRITIENRGRLEGNKNLLYWYEQLYAQQFGDLPNFESMRVLEIGSGTSPIKRFHPHVLTSDVLELDYLDFVFDCHDLDRFGEIGDSSLDVITATNVLHHLENPIGFMKAAAVKLKPGGRLIATEPYFSSISSLIYRHLHHEPVDFDLEEPRLSEVVGPLASANIALPYLIFKEHPEWVSQLGSVYDLPVKIHPFTGIAYMATGGISRVIPIPDFLYRWFFAMDNTMARVAPDLLASFFTVELLRSN